MTALGLFLLGWWIHDGLEKLAKALIYSADVVEKIKLNPPAGEADKEEK